MRKKTKGKGISTVVKVIPIAYSLSKKIKKWMEDVSPKLKETKPVQIIKTGEDTYFFDYQ